MPVLPARRDAYVDSRNPGNTPQDGDISICANCSGLSVFHGSELRLPTPEELAELRSVLYGFRVF